MRCTGCGIEPGPEDIFCPECGLRSVGSSSPKEKAVRGPEAAVEPSGHKEGSRPASPMPPATSDLSVTPATPESPTTPSTPSPAVLPTPSPSIAPHPRAKTSGWGIASLAMGIAGLTCLPVIGAILAVVFGVSGRKEARRSTDRIRGSGLATAGLTLGIIGLVLPLLIASVATPLGYIYRWPRVEARMDLIRASDAALAYFEQNDRSYNGMTPTVLKRFDDGVEYRKGHGGEPGVVYIHEAEDSSATLYRYDRRGRKYTAYADGDDREYSFELTDPERDRWWDEWWSPFD